MNRHRFVLGTLVLLIIALAALLAGCGGSKSNPMAPGPVAGADVTISIVGILGPNSYSPASAACKVGQKVAWRNDAGGAHTATSDPGAPAAFDTGAIAAGATSALITMTTQGVYPYHCSIHGQASMSGTLTVNP
jgi:plastocyanin